MKFIKKHRRRLAKDARPLKELGAWLHKRGTMWLPHVRHATRGVTCGFGLVATDRVKKGDVLFCVPKGAALGARGPRDKGDTQRRLATALIEETRKGSASRWCAFVRSLRPAPCPWTWDSEEVAALAGTELEAVVAVKLKRLEAERVEVRKEVGALSRRAYARACAVVASHANPWFGRAVVPFNCALNHGDDDDLEIEERDGVIVARATRSRGPGELFLNYAECHSELIYKYGFVPETEALLPGDVVSIPLVELGSVCRDVEVKAPRDAPVTRITVGPVTTALLKGSAVDRSPWDGLEGTITLEIGVEGEGLGRLVGAALALAADVPAFVAGCRAFDATLVGGERRFEPDEDTWAACCVAAATGAAGADADALLATAISAGGADRDPWPALIERAARSKPARPALKRAVAHARAALVARRALLGPPIRDALRLAKNEESVFVGVEPPPAPGSPRALAARLKVVERTVLDDALEALDGWKLF